MAIKRLTPHMRAQILDLIEAKIRKAAATYGRSKDDVLAAVQAANIIVQETIANDVDGIFVDESYSPLSQDIILINPDTNEPFGAVLAHEYTRFLLRNWVPQVFFDTDTVLCFKQDNSAERFSMATEMHSRFV